MHDGAARPAASSGRANGKAGCASMFRNVFQPDVPTNQHSFPGQSRERGQMLETKLIRVQSMLEQEMLKVSRLEEQLRKAQSSNELRGQQLRELEMLLQQESAARERLSQELVHRQDLVRSMGDRLSANTGICGKCGRIDRLLLQARDVTKGQSDCASCETMRGDLKALQAAHHAATSELATMKAYRRAAMQKQRKVPPLFRQQPRHGMNPDPSMRRGSSQVDVSVANGSVLYRVCSLDQQQLQLTKS